MQTSQTPLLQILHAFVSPSKPQGEPHKWRFSLKNILALVLSRRSFLSSASTIFISSSASLLFHCQFQSILASVGENKGRSFSRLKSWYGFRVSVGSVMCCCSVLSPYSMWETLRTAKGSNGVWWCHSSPAQLQYWQSQMIIQCVGECSRRER